MAGSSRQHLKNSVDIVPKTRAKSTGPGNRGKRSPESTTGTSRATKKAREKGPGNPGSVSRKARSYPGSQERKNALLVLNETVGKPMSKWMTADDLWGQRKRIMPDREITLENFREWWESTRKDYFIHPDKYGRVRLLACDRKKEEAIEIDQATGDYKENIRGKTPKFSLSKEYHEAGLPLELGRILFRHLRYLQEEARHLRLPSSFHISTDLMDYLRETFGVEADHDRKTGKNQKKNPELVANSHGRVPGNFLIQRFDGRPLSRDHDEEHQRISNSYRVAEQSFLLGRWFEFNYQATPSAPVKRIKLDIACAMLSVKNSGIYFYGCVPDKENPSNYMMEKGGSGQPKEKIWNFKLDRMFDPNVSQEPSRLGTLLQEIRSEVLTNDGVFLVDKSSRFEAIVKVSGDYISYLRESMPFQRAESLDKRQLEMIGQPAVSHCLRIRATSKEHLSNEVFKARGNLVVLWPQHMVEFVQDESARMIDALRGFEPVFKNKEHQAPHLATTPRGTLNDGSQNPFDQEGNPEGT